MMNELESHLYYNQIVAENGRMAKLLAARAAVSEIEIEVIQYGMQHGRGEAYEKAMQRVGKLADYLKICDDADHDANVYRLMAEHYKRKNVVLQAQLDEAIKQLKAVEAAWTKKL